MTLTDELDGVVFTLDQNGTLDVGDKFTFSLLELRGFLDAFATVLEAVQRSE